MIIGLLVIISYLATVIGYVLGRKGTIPAWGKMASRIGALLLLAQYALGFSLLGSSDDLPNPIHYVVALATAFTIGAEHMLAGQEADPAKKARLGLIFSVATLVLVLAAYAIGDANTR
jgi:hypothetical protein